MDQDGVYHVAGVEQGQPVRVSEDFFIEARKANPPQITLVRPAAAITTPAPSKKLPLPPKPPTNMGSRASTLHYSVNGGPETTVDLLKQKGTKEADGSTTISLEDFKLVPGDLVSVYATAKDANAEAHTDMMFIQADPFEREFSQSQSGGGGGGGGGGGKRIRPRRLRSGRRKSSPPPSSSRRTKNRPQQQAADIAKLLSQSQATLHDQSVTLSGRLQARELTDEMQAISDFQKDMIAASDAMSPAAQQLATAEVEGCHSERAESAAIPAACRSHFPADSGCLRAARRWRRRRGRRAARDLAALFDLELDTEKNQYETQKPRLPAPNRRSRKSPTR